MKNYSINKAHRNGKKPIPIGRTLKTKDKYLSHDSDKNLKEKRWVAVIDKNANEELAVVRLTTKNTKNTTHLPTYNSGNKKKTYFKHFVETKDNAGNPIKVDNKKFYENSDKYDLKESEVKAIQNKVFHKVKQSQKNNDLIKNLKNK